MIKYKPAVCKASQSGEAGLPGKDCCFSFFGIEVGIERNYLGVMP